MSKVWMPLRFIPVGHSKQHSDTLQKKHAVAAACRAPGLQILYERIFSVYRGFFLLALIQLALNRLLK